MPPPHYPALDGLRGIAALLVVGFHAGTLLRLGASAGWGGWIGVDLFFVLSGFLITSVLLRSRDDADRLRAFWIRRARRLFPSYYLLLGAAALLAALGVEGLADLRTFDGWGWYALYASNLRDVLDTQPAPTPGLSIAWSLAVEEQFYLLWPLVVFGCSRAQLVRVCALLIAAAPFARAMLVWDERHIAAYTFTLCHTDALAAGALLAVARLTEAGRDATDRWARRLLPLSLLVVAIFLFGRFRPLHWNPGGGALGAAARGLVLAAAGTGLVAACLSPPPWLARVLGWRPLAFVGAVSYGLYLWHSLLAYVLRGAWEAGAWPLWARFGSWAALTTAVVLLLWYGVERPLLRRRPGSRRSTGGERSAPARDAA